MLKLKKPIPQVVPRKLTPVWPDNLVDCHNLPLSLPQMTIEVAIMAAYIENVALASNPSDNKLLKLRDTY